MLIALGILSMTLLGVIIKFAVSPTSSPYIKRAAIIALVFIVLSVGVCAVLLIRGPGKTTGDFPFPAFQDEAPPPKKSNVPAVLSYIVLLLFIVGLMVYILRTGQLGKAVRETKADDSAIFKKKSEIDKMIEGKEPDKKEDGENFDIDIN
jgi:uncharacterized SAM-binding protein YcdF (DUF218 family)